jgi:hypothetical protein
MNTKPNKTLPLNQSCDSITVGEKVVSKKNSPTPKAIK